MDELMREADAALTSVKSGMRLDEDRLIALAFNLAGGCPATIDAELDTQARSERKQAIASLIAAVGEAGTKRGLTKLLQLATCGIEAPGWGRERILERAMARMIAAVPCLPPLSSEVEGEREKLAEFPILRLRKGVLRAELPTRQELSDLAYFMVAVAEAGEEVGARDEGASSHRKLPANEARAGLFQDLTAAKGAGRLLDVERLARGYLETLGFPDPLHGAEEDVISWHAPRYYLVMRDLAESWEALGRFHDAAGLWRRNSRTGAACGTGASYAWQQQVKAVIRDEEIAGRCDVAAAERLLDVEGSVWESDDPYGPRRLADAGFDLARLYRGAVLTINRDAGEKVVKKVVEALPEIPRLFVTMRLRDKGPEDWERRIHAARGLADTMQRSAIPLLLQVAQDSLPPGRQRAIEALGALAERPWVDPCGGSLEARSIVSSEWTRPIRPIGQSCDEAFGATARNHLARELLAYAQDRDAGTREAAASALGKIAALSARPALRRLLVDGARVGQVCSQDSDSARERCRPHYPVREAARKALDNLAELERNWHKTVKVPSMPHVDE